MLSPAHFPDPLTFSPERRLVDDHKSNRYLMPFDRGTRGCLGQNLALAEITLALAFLFRRFEFSVHDTDARSLRGWFGQGE